MKAFCYRALSNRFLCYVLLGWFTLGAYSNVRASWRDPFWPNAWPALELAWDIFETVAAMFFVGCLYYALDLARTVIQKPSKPSRAGK